MSNFWLRFFGVFMGRIKFFFSNLGRILFSYFYILLWNVSTKTLRKACVGFYCGQKVPFWQFFRNRLIGWIAHALLVQASISAHRKWPEMVVSTSTNQIWTFSRNGLWFGFSERDTSSVISKFVFEILAVKMFC